MCSSSSRARSGPSAVMLTSIQLTAPPNFHVAVNLWGGSHSRTVPTRVALELVVPAGPQFAGDREKPARYAVDVRTCVPQIVGISRICLADGDDAGLPRLQHPGADRPAYRADLMAHVDHVVSLRRCLFPRATSVASALRCGVQNRRKVLSHSSTSRNGALFTHTGDAGRRRAPMRSSCRATPSSAAIPQAELCRTQPGPSRRRRLRSLNYLVRRSASGPGRQTAFRAR
jgi:hypothetical protein